jgi:tetratricopeptide (TPR) repeat protein
VQVNLGLLREATGDVEAAAAAYRRALELDPAGVDARLNLGRLLARDGRLEAAAAVWAEGADDPAAPPELLFNLAVARAAGGDFAASAALLRRALDRAPDDERIVSALAELLATCPDPAVRDGDEAVRLGRRLLERHGIDHLPSLSLVAAAEAERGAFDLAVRLAERALAIARRTGDPRLVAMAESRLARYRAGRPHHQPRP